jgi:hypothetical protein
MAEQPQPAGPRPADLPAPEPQQISGVWSLEPVVGGTWSLHNDAPPA